MTNKTRDLEIPEGLSTVGRSAAHEIVHFLRTKHDTNTGGCRTFYTPGEWADRGEDYGLDAVLIVVHDGGCCAPYFNLDYCAYSMWEEMQAHLEKHGYWAEQCTTWYTAVYAR